LLVRCSHSHVEKEMWLGMQWFDGSHGASGHTLAHHDSHRVSHHETLDYPSSLAYIQDMRSERGVGVPTLNHVDLQR
jgi:hypothetical protein